MRSDWSNHIDNGRGWQRSLPSLGNNERVLNRSIMPKELGFVLPEGKGAERTAVLHLSPNFNYKSRSQIRI